ncbi:hypothetical protein DFJ58DRAFT_730355 [Suillus subalutaceus]|uniref:uncharacterized protein n=1 Tax=Suillus subalutaceus TaxID=48586 RepID=UPI001B86C4CB|nr:uncharacterized protein DFJ58DRAFT_730355 [Suillus subalutaceus]KAG1847026.1 hypothetical protein DFJ58DRAFT_730355 [Suillus subalutaceus]
MSLNLKRKPRDKPAAYTRPAKKQKITNDTPSRNGNILDPAEERDNGDFLNFEGGNQAIADEVRHEIAVANGEIVGINSDDESEEDGPSFTRTELLNLCQQLETGCMQHGDPQFSLNLSSQLRLFRARLRREELLNAKQTSIDRYFKA